jgi:hypothetical protein
MDQQMDETLADLEQEQAEKQERLARSIEKMLANAPRRRLAAGSLQPVQFASGTIDMEVADGNTDSDGDESTTVDFKIPQAQMLAAQKETCVTCVCCAITDLARKSMFGPDGYICAACSADLNDIMKE